MKKYKRNIENTLAIDEKALAFISEAEMVC